MFNILILTKRQYMDKDLIDDLFGRFREIPFELGNMGHSVTGVCLSYRKRKEGLFKDGEVRWHSINAGKLKFAGLIHFIRKAKKYAASADLIWACSDSFYGIIGHALSRRYRIPFIFDLYDNFEYYFTAKLPIVRQLYRHAVRHGEAVTCVSEPLATLVEKSYGKNKRVFILENAVRKDLFRPLGRSSCRRLLHLPQEGKLIGTAGALTKNRGIEYLFDAYFRLKTLHPDLHLVIAGPRDISIPKDERIHDLGSLRLENVPYLFNALDVAVVCIKDDAFGRYCFPQKAREIMACDVPISASNVGSLRATFSAHPEWLFEPDSTESIVSTINHRLSERMTGYDFLPSWKDMALNFNKIIQEIRSE
jgi:glycosyltransferase involved in cell wall biosynthesis